MDKFPKWTAAHIPSQRGRSAIVTGTGGLGYETALALAKHGAEVILAGRNAAKGPSRLKESAAPFLQPTYASRSWT